MNGENNELTREVYIRVGRNLLLFQKIESRLRIIYPHLYIDNGRLTVEPPSSIDKLFQQSKSQLMLGALLKELKKITSPSEFLEFNDYLTFVHEERNSFIHDLENHPEFGVRSVNQCKDSIKYLDRQYNICSPLLTLLDELNKTAVSTLSILHDSESSS